MAAFRFAVQVSRTATAAEWRDLARKAEDLGYATLYVPDHLDDQWAPMIALAVAAEATTTMRVGTLVLDNDFRHPVLMAKEAATLDAMTGGRFELGLGAGWLRVDYDQSGIPMEPAGRAHRAAGRSDSRSCVPCGRQAVPPSRVRTTASPTWSAHRHRSPRAGRRWSSAEAAGASWSWPGVTPTSSASSRAWPPAMSVPRWRPRPSRRSTPTACAGPSTPRGTGGRARTAVLDGRRAGRPER